MLGVNLGNPAILDPNDTPQQQQQRIDWTMNDLPHEIRAEAERDPNIMDILNDIKVTMMQQAQLQRARFIGPTPQGSTRLPQNWQQFSGRPDAVLEEYRLWENQAERSNFRTWKDFYDQFLDCII